MLTKLADNFVNSLKQHLVVIVYFAFFVLALMPTFFNLTGTISIVYKVSLLVLLAFVILTIAIVRRIKINFRVGIMVVAFFIAYAAYFLAMNKYQTLIAPPFSASSGTQITVFVNKSMTLSSIVSIFNICFFIILFLVFAPSFKLNKSDYVCFSILYSIFLAAVCLISIPEVISTLKSQYDFASIFQNKNTYGFFLMVGVFVTLLSSTLSSNKALKIIFVILSFVFFAFTILSKCSTAAALSTFIMLVASIYCWMDIKRISKTVKIIILVTFITIALFVLASPFIPFIPENFVTTTLSNFYNKISSFKDGNFYTIFTGRGYFWALGVYMIEPQYLMLGRGVPAVEEFAYMSNVSYAITRVLVNTYLTVINAYGLVGFLFFIGFIIFMFWIYIKSQDKMSDWLIVFLIVYVIYAFFETAMIFDSFSGSLVMTPLLVVPSIYLSKDVFNRSKIIQKIKGLKHEEN